MSKAGLVESTRRGHFRITARGQSLLATLPKKITKATLVQFAEYRAWWEQSKSADKDGTASAPTAASDDGDTATPEERIEASHAALTGALRAEVLERVLEVSPAFFENLIIDLLVALGYGGGRADMGKAIGKSGDGGIDGIIKEDALGLDIVYIQAKRYSRDHSVGRPDVQSFAGSLDGVGATKGVFVTTSTFAKPAREFVDRISKRIVLIDGDELARLMIQHNVGVRVRNMYEVKKIDEDYFSV